MTVSELIEKLSKVSPNALVKVSIVEPYDDEPETLEKYATDIKLESMGMKHNVVIS